MVKSFWADIHNNGVMKLEIEETGGVKITMEELEEYFETIKIDSKKITGDTIYDVERWSNVKIKFKKNKE
tara:strand:- start:1398 stop:1607 length:210 start_codon:yes stop_codon:yes gene_type:complete